MTALLSMRVQGSLAGLPVLSDPLLPAEVLFLSEPLVPPVLSALTDRPVLSLPVAAPAVWEANHRIVSSCSASISTIVVSIKVVVVDAL